VKIKEDKFVVRTHECQADGKIKVVSLMQYLQDIAARHADQLGFGFERLNEIGGYWVLSNIRVDIVGLPKWNDEMTIRTWPSGCTRVIATREFIGEDRYGCELFRAGSEWMILDKKKNRPKNLFRLDLDLPDAGPKAIQGQLNRLEPRDGCVEVDRVCVPYSSIDLNGHVNNTEYVRWGMDALMRAFRPQGTVRCVQTTYLSEAFEGDELDLLVSSDKSGNFRVLGRRTGTTSNVYIMEAAHQDDAGTA